MTEAIREASEGQGLHFRGPARRNRIRADWRERDDGHVEGWYYKWSLSYGPWCEPCGPFMTARLAYTAGVTDAAGV